MGATGSRAGVAGEGGVTATTNPQDRPPNVTELPIVPEAQIGTLPSGLEARLLGGDWYGNGPEIVIWHPEHELHYNVPLKRKETMLPHAIRVVLAAAKAKSAGMEPYRDRIGEGYWVTGQVASNVSPDMRRMSNRQHYKGSHRA